MPYLFLRHLCVCPLQGRFTLPNCLRVIHPSVLFCHRVPHGLLLHNCRKSFLDAHNLLPSREKESQPDWRINPTQRVEDLQKFTFSTHACRKPEKQRVFLEKKRQKRVPTQPETDKRIGHGHTSARPKLEGRETYFSNYILFVVASWKIA